MANGILTRTLFSSPQILCILPTGKHIENLNHDVAVVYESRVEFLKTHTDGRQEIVQTLEYWPDGGIIAAGVSWCRKAIFISTQHRSFESIDLDSDSFRRRPYNSLNTSPDIQYLFKGDSILFIRSDPDFNIVVALSRTGTVWYIMPPGSQTDSEGRGLLTYQGSFKMAIAAAEFLRPTSRVTKTDEKETALRLLVLGHDFEGRPVAKVMSFVQRRVEPWIRPLSNLGELMNQGLLRSVSSASQMVSNLTQSITCPFS